MAIMVSQMPGCIVRLYDLLGNLVVTSTIASYDDLNMEIELDDMIRPEEYDALKNGDTYRVLIIAKPHPVEYLGTAKLKGYFPKTIALYRGQEKESRKHPRYRIETFALIESVIYRDLAYPLSVPLAVRVVNISKGGLRLRTERDAMAKGDRFELSMEISGKREFFLIEVRNSVDIGTSESEYGCAFLANGKRLERVM